jgi:hypothetical protein
MDRERDRCFPCEICRETLVFCRSVRSFTAVIDRYDLGPKTGQDRLEFLASKGIPGGRRAGGGPGASPQNAPASMRHPSPKTYRNLSDTVPGFKL